MSFQGAAISKSDGNAGKSAKRIICWIRVAPCHGDLPCCTLSLSVDANSKSCLLGQLAILSWLQCVRKTFVWMEVLGSSSHLLVVCRGLLKDGIG